MPLKAQRSYVRPSREFLVDVINKGSLGPLHVSGNQTDLLRLDKDPRLLHKPAIDDRPPRSPYFGYEAMFTRLSAEELLASDGFRTGSWLNLQASDKERCGECPT